MEKRDKIRSRNRILILWAILCLFSLMACAFLFKWSLNAKVFLVLGSFTMTFVGLIAVMGDKYIKYTLIAPSAVILFAVTIIPIVFLLVMSVTDVKLANFNKKWNFVGFDNYKYFLTDDRLFFPALIRTFEYTVIVLICQLIIGMGLALLLQRAFKGRSIVSSFLVIPVMTCPIVIAMLWKSMMNADNGVLNNILMSLGMNEIPWLTNQPLRLFESLGPFGDFCIKHLNANIGFLSVILVNIWQWTPFVFLLLLSGLSALPKEPYEAAMVDGATTWQTFRAITLPLLKPVLNVVILMRLIDLMKVYDQIYALFGDNITMRTLNIHIFTIGLTNQDYGRGSALSVIVLLFIIILTKSFMGLNERIGEGRNKE